MRLGGAIRESGEYWTRKEGEWSDPVFENSCGAKNSRVANPVNFWKIQKKSVKFAKIRPNHV
jgi:hypothetical protein